MGRPRSPTVSDRQTKMARMVDFTTPSLLSTTRRRYPFFAPGMAAYFQVPSLLLTTETSARSSQSNAGGGSVGPSRFPGSSSIRSIRFPTLGSNVPATSFFGSRDGGYPPTGGSGSLIFIGHGLPIFTGLTLPLN